MICALGHPLFFRLLSNAFSDFGSVGRKRKKKTKIKLELGGQVPQYNIRRAWEQQGVVTQSTWRQWKKEGQKVSLVVE